MHPFTYMSSHTPELFFSGLPPAPVVIPCWVQRGTNQHYIGASWTLMDFTFLACFMEQNLSEIKCPVMLGMNEETRSSFHDVRACVMDTFPWWLKHYCRGQSCWLVLCGRQCFSAESKTTVRAKLKAILTEYKLVWLPGLGVGFSGCQFTRTDIFQPFFARTVSTGTPGCQCSGHPLCV